jgi:hypothetical protein
VSSNVNANLVVLGLWSSFGGVNLRPDGKHWPLALAAGAVPALSPLQRPSDGV